jgi:hypothetical protein
VGAWLKRAGLAWILLLLGLELAFSLAIVVGVLLGGDGNAFWLILLALFWTPVLVAPGGVAWLAGYVMQARQAPGSRRRRILRAWRRWPGHTQPARVADVREFHDWLLANRNEWLGTGSERFGLPELHAWLGPVVP